MKPSEISLNIFEITRLEKKICQDILNKLKKDNPKFTQDELSYIQRMNQYNMLLEDDYKNITRVFISLAISKKI